jgi:hypothetical protein
MDMDIGLNLKWSVWYGVKQSANIRGRSGSGLSRPKISTGPVSHTHAEEIKKRSGNVKGN